MAYIQNNNPVKVTSCGRRRSTAAGNSPFKQIPVKKGKTKWTPETIEKIKKQMKRYNENFQFGPDGHWHNDGIGIT